jgi:glycosyltransferase involved in cell wall biosynthesis
MMELPGASDMRADSDIREAASLRVVIISDALPERNGVGTYYHDLVEHLCDYIGYAELLCPYSDGAGPWKGWLSFPLPGDRTQKITLPPVRQIHKRIRQILPNTIIVPTPGPYGLLGMYLAKRYGLNLLVGFHTDFEKLTDLYWNRLFEKFSRAFLRSFHRFLFRQSSLVLANSKEMVAVAGDMGAGRVRLMGTPIDRKFLQEPVTPPANGLRRILFAGRLAAEKNVHSVIAAAEELPDIQFLIAGDGPLRDLIITQSRKLSNLTYLGWLPRAKMPATLDSVDMLVLPSRVESFGTTALEAMARKRIVLASEKCGIFDWPLLKKSLFRFREKENLTDAIRQIEQLDHQRWREKAEGACSAARQFNDWTISNWLGILRMDGVV